MNTRVENNKPRQKQIAGTVEGGSGGKRESQQQSSVSNYGSGQDRGASNLSAKTILAWLGGVIAVIVAVFVIKAYLLLSGTPGDPNLTTYVDSTTGQSFSHRVGVGETIPILSPYTNQNTGYPAVPCYWTKDGQLRKEPFWLVLNSALGKPEPTFCPDCGRLVRPRQPIPKPGDTPPPTQQELLHD